MSCYIASNQNRFYVALESNFGDAAAITAANRLPAVKLGIQHETIQGKRRDKTGSRTRGQMPASGRSRTQFNLETYLANWPDPATEPAYGPLIRASMGADPKFTSGLVFASLAGTTTLTVGGPHNLSAGNAVSFGSDIRFVKQVVNATTVELNAPFSITPSAGSALNPTLSYSLANELPSVSLYDYWTPATAVQRMMTGAAVDRMRIRVNSDFHEFHFSGEARGLLDSASFTSGLAGLTDFPPEPALGPATFSVVPGHIGQLWMGVTPTQWFSLTEAEISINNNVDMRHREFGAQSASCFAAGDRNVGIRFKLFQQDDNATRELYNAARTRTPISIALQLGQQSRQICGVFMQNVIAEVPEFDDGSVRLEWNFGLSSAFGSINDEIQIAFA